MLKYNASDMFNIKLPSIHIKKLKTTGSRNIKQMLSPAKYNPKP